MRRFSIVVVLIIIAIEVPCLASNYICVAVFPSPCPTGDTRLLDYLTQPTYTGNNGSANILPGTNVSVAPTSSTMLLFSNVTSSGTITAIGLPSVYPYGYTTIPGTAYSINSTANFTGNITVGIKCSYGNINNIKLLRWNGQSWDDITTIIDTTNKIVYGSTSSLSYFVAGEVATVPVAIVPVTTVPVMNGLWLLPGALAGVGFFARRRKDS